MLVGTYWDKSVTSALVGNALPGFNTIMGRTIFEGSLPGANDVVSIMLILAVGIYTFDHFSRNRQSKLSSWRPQIGFILTSGLIVGFFMVHGLKYLIGRARPSLVLNEAWPYSLWFVFGPHAITEGNFNASFPSGHTAEAFVLMSVAYALAGDPLATRRTKALGWMIGAIALGFSAAMGVARCASQNHWLTDVLGSICLGWLLIHWIYFGLLKVPAQRIHRSKLGHLPLLPRAWELMLCVGLLFMGGGVIIAVNSVRGLMNAGPLWLGWLIPAAAGLVWIGSRLFSHYQKIIHTILCG
jgi:membrane-associated phospholipid phosphatase